MSVRRSLGIATLTRGAVFVISFVTVVVVSRLLSPEEIGIFSVSVAILGFAHVFRDFGVGQYLVQVKEVTREKRRAAFTVTLAFSWSIAVLLAAANPLVADFYGNAGVGEILLLLAINFVILPFGSPLRNLLQREMKFGSLAVVNLSNHLVQSATTIAMAWLGASYASMAWGSIAGNIANVVVLLLISPTRALDWPTRHGLREVLSFGSRASVASLAGSAGAAAPDLILGRTLGFAEVAFYSRAKGLISMALDQLMYVVRSVYAPAFAQGFREGRDGATLYVQTVGLLLGLTVPVIALLALLAPYLILWLFGPQWERSAPLGSLFCIFALVIAPFTLASTSLVASGHVGPMMRSRLVIESVRVAVMLVSIVASLEVVAVLLGAVYFVEAWTSMRALRTSLGLTARRLWAGIWRSYALLPCVLAGPALVVGVDHWWRDLPVLVVLPLAATAALAGWLAGLALLEHPLQAEARHAAAWLGVKWRKLSDRGQD
jgi:O-antigen/teichoic acid export membrane protein